MNTHAIIRNAKKLAWEFVKFWTLAVTVMATVLWGMNLLWGPGGLLVGG